MRYICIPNIKKLQKQKLSAKKFKILYPRQKIFGDSKQNLVKIGHTIYKLFNDE